MTSHAIFLCTCILIKCMMPIPCAYIATETALASLWRVWYPLLSTIVLLYDEWASRQEGKKGKETEQKKHVKSTSKNNSKNNLKSRSKSHAISLRESKQASNLKRRSAGNSSGSRNSVATSQKPMSLLETARRMQDTTIPRDFCKEQQYWLHYWMVCGILAALQRFVHWVPFVARAINKYTVIHSIACQLEVVFWLWINVMPTFVPPALQQHQPYETPVECLAVSVIGPACINLYEALSSVVPARVWDEYVVVACRKALRMLVWTAALSEQTADDAVYAIHEGRGLVVPLLLTVFVWPLRTIGVLCVGWVLPLAKSSLACTKKQKSSKEQETTLAFLTRWNQVWVLHTILTAALAAAQPVLWWIPFSNVMVFALYAYLCTSSSINSTYKTYIMQELQAFHVLPSPVGTTQKTMDDTKAMQAWNLLIDALPKADDLVVTGTTDPPDTVTVRNEESDPIRTANVGVQQESATDELDLGAVDDDDDEDETEDKLIMTAVQEEMENGIPNGVTTRSRRSRN